MRKPMPKQVTIKKAPLKTVTKAANGARVARSARSGRFSEAVRYIGKRDSAGLVKLSKI